MLKQVAIVSGKGGTGKTSLTAAFARLAAPVAVVDADVDAADLALVLRPTERERHDYHGLPVAEIDARACLGCMACAQVCRFAALTRRGGAALADPAVCEGCGACAVICPAQAVAFRPRRTGAWMVADTACGPLVHARLDPGAEHAGRLTTAVRERGRELAAARGLGLVLIDGPPGIGCAATAAVAGADLAVAVSEPTPAAEADLDRLRARLAQLRVPLALVVNRADRAPDRARRMLAATAASGGHALGVLPTDPAFRAAQRAGATVLDCGGPELRRSLHRLWDGLCALLDLPTPRKASMNHPTIAIPVSDGKVDPHFGHCAAFALLETDGVRVTGRRDLAPPKHEPGVLPRWLVEQGVRVVIAGGMGERAQSLLAKAGVTVVLGASDGCPEELAQRFLAGALASRGGACTAHVGHGCGGH